MKLRRTFVRRTDGVHRTRMELAIPSARFTFEVEGRLHLRQRRTLCLALIRAIEPILKTVPGKLGYRIRMRRLELGLSQRDLAARVQIHPTTLIAIEKGRARIRPSTRH